MSLRARATRAALLAGTLALAAAVAGCGAGTDRAGPPLAGTGGAVRAGSSTDWLGYHADAARSGVVRGLPRAGELSGGWSRPLDGAVYGQPLVVHGLVVAATENDSVYGIDRVTGQVRWHRRVGTPLPLAGQPCGNIDPLGITSTPVYVPATGLVYVLAQDGRTGHLLVGLEPASGLVRYRRAVPAPDGAPWYDQQRGALAAGNGVIYVTFGGHFGDCGAYVGSVVGMPAAGTGPVVWYLVPTSAHAGIWAPGGPVIGPDGTVFVAVGNGAVSVPYDASDSVTALTPRLRPAGIFAPARWVADNRTDLDLGSMTPALAGGLLLAVGKSGTGYLLGAGRLRGVGSQSATAAICSAYGGAAVDGRTVFVPCASGGPAAVALAPGEIRVRWRGPAGANGSPVVGGGAVWVTDNPAGVLYQLDPATGQVLHQISLGSALPNFASPALSGRLVLVGTMRGVVAVAGG
ncbi:MAG TPA: PQQ-binding-like beta-propeller repeat protein [Streptosporangiaceae bacterium]|nr:PQQ-binding-like beta-propeller repeat protein [Streptosporangiaceae bacterium]